MKNQKEMSHTPSRESEDKIYVPILGLVDAGSATILADEGEAKDFMLIKKEVLKGKRKVFGLEIAGDSMDQYVLNGIPLKSGNYIIVAKNDSSINDGDVVVAILDQGATVKKYSKANGKIWLEPQSSNRNYQPLDFEAFHDAQIAGKVIAALHNPNIERTL